MIALTDYFNSSFPHMLTCLTSHVCPSHLHHGLDWNHDFKCMYIFFLSLISLACCAKQNHKKSKLLCGVSLEKSKGKNMSTSKIKKSKFIVYFENLYIFGKPCMCANYPKQYGNCNFELINVHSLSCWLYKTLGWSWLFLKTFPRKLDRSWTKQTRPI